MFILVSSPMGKPYRCLWLTCSTTKFSDLVQLPPYEHYKVFRDAIEDRINEKYSNKVVQKVGLCICLWDLTKTSDGLVGHGSGNLNFHVEFRMIVFRPFKGEVIAASIGKSTADGIHLTTQFFEDIFVPRNMLFEGSEFVEEERTWVWRPEEGMEFWLDEGTKVHARIENEHWEDLAPKGPDKPGDERMRKVPYRIEASMAEQGLGGTEWW